MDDIADHLAREDPTNGNIVDDIADHSPREDPTKRNIGEE